MISQPSCARLLQVVRTELVATVTPAVSDPGVLAALGMIDSILQNVATRCDHEVAWMREEIADVEASAEHLIASGGDAGGAVGAALQSLRAHRSPSDHVTDVQQEYNLAGEVLSCALEAALPIGGDVRGNIQAALDRRLRREVEIRGEFTLVGR